MLTFLRQHVIAVTMCVIFLMNHYAKMIRIFIRNHFNSNDANVYNVCTRDKIQIFNTFLWINLIGRWCIGTAYMRMRFMLEMKL